jgi:hypothetical protein
MRALICVFGALLLLGCNSSSHSSSDASAVARSLQRRITPEEARRIFLSDLDALVAITKTNSATEGSHEIATGVHEDFEAELKTFLGRFEPPDELWLYKGLKSLRPRGTETGFARVRKGEVLDHMVARIDP